MATMLCALWPSVAAGQAPCADWNTLAFFKNVKAEDVMRRIASGADLEARDKLRMTPLHWAAVTSTAPAVVTPLLEALSS